MSDTKNCHYIPKHLIKPWSIKPGKVRKFTFATKEFEEEDIETLFAKEFLFTQEQENFFNKHIETISKQELLSIQDPKYKTKKRKNYRALVLLLWDLVGRQVAVKNGNLSAVNYLTGLNVSQLEELTQVIESQFTLCVATVPADGKLSFHNTFILSAFEPATQNIVFGIPFSGNHILLTVPHGADLAYLYKLSKNHFFINNSVGGDNTDFILVHPDVSLTSELPDKLIQARSNNQTMMSQIRDFRKKVEEIYKAADLQLPTPNY